MPDAPQTQQPLTQRQLDRLAFDLYVDCGRSWAETSRQSGVAVSTLRGRVRRHALRLSGIEVRPS